MSRSSSETQSLRRSAQPTRPCAEAHALPHAQRSSVSYALSPPRSHGTAPRPTGPLRHNRRSIWRGHVPAPAVAPTHSVRPWPRTRPTRLRGRVGAPHARRSAASHAAPATAATAAVCSLASRVTSQLCFNWTRLRGPCGSAVADTAKRTVHHAQRAPYPVPVRKLSPHVTARAVATRGTPCVYAAIAHAQNPCVSYRRVQSFFC